MESGEVRCVVFSAEKWIDVSLAEELRKRLLPGEKVIWRDAFRWKDDAGAMSNHYEQASVASLAAEFGYTVIVDAGCSAIIRDPKTFTVPHDASKEGQHRLFAKGVEAIRDAAAQCPPPAPDGEAVAELNLALGKAFPDDQVSAIKAQSAVLPMVRRIAERLALMDKHAAIDNQVIQMLIAAGHITSDIASQAFKIAHGFEDGQLKPANNRSWWKDVKPETDLAEANDVIGCMLEDWQKVGEALGFKDFADPESIIGLCKELFEGVRAQAETPAADEFSDIREFRRRATEMDRRDAEQLAERHDEILRAQFPREASVRDKARAAVTDFLLDALTVSEGSAVTVVEFRDFQEFDALLIGAGSIPEAPVPITAEPAWKRDEEKTMLRILLLSADTTGFHGNDPAVHLAKIAKWTDDECRAVDDWCVAMHLHAGDRGVRVPPKPKVLVPERPAEVADPMAVIRQALEPVSAEEFERMVISIIVAETRYPMHHFTRAAKMITELHARGLAE